MYWLDTIIIGALGFGAIAGAFSGFLWQVSRILALVMGLYCAFVFNDVSTSFIQTHFLPDSSALLAHGIAFLAVFFLVGLSLFVLGTILTGIIRNIKLMWLNRLLGSLFGALKVGLFFGFLLLGFSYIPLPTASETIKKSTVAPVLASAARISLNLLPQESPEQNDSTPLKSPPKENAPKEDENPMEKTTPNSNQPDSNQSESQQKVTVPVRIKPSPTAETIDDLLRDLERWKFEKGN